MLFHNPARPVTLSRSNFQPLRTAISLMINASSKCFPRALLVLFLLLTQDPVIAMRAPFKARKWAPQAPQSKQQQQQQPDGAAAAASGSPFFEQQPGLPGDSYGDYQLLNPDEVPQYSAPCAISPTSDCSSLPPQEAGEIDPRYGVEKRLVPTGPNPLHN